MSFFSVKAKGENRAEITIDKVIATDWEPDWVTDFFGDQSARMFIDAVEALGELNDIDVYLNSPGGDVASGIRIMNYLKDHQAKVNIYVTGTAASITSVIMMAGDTRHMGIGTNVMIHDPSGWMGGWFTEAEMRERADAMAAIKTGIVAAYMYGTGLGEDEIVDLLSNGDRYIDADEAVSLGFATSKDESFKAVACANPSHFKQQLDLGSQLAKAKESVIAEQSKNQELTERNEALSMELDAFKNPVAAEMDYVLTACSDAGFEPMAVEMLKAKLPVATVTNRLTMASKVRDLCKAAEISPDAVVPHVGDPVQMLQIVITEAKALGDQDLDHHINPEKGNQQQPSSKKAYAQLNQTS